MKGFVLKTDNRAISARLDTGVTSMLISNKEFYYKLDLSALDNNNVSYIWHKAELRLNDVFTISYEEIADISPVQEIRDLKDMNENDLRALESYHSLKQELINEGLITP